MWQLFYDTIDIKNIFIDFLLQCKSFNDFLLYFMQKTYNCTFWNTHKNTKYFFEYMYGSISISLPLSLSLPVSLRVSLSVSFSVSLFPSISISVTLSLSLSLFLCLSLFFSLCFYQFAFLLSFAVNLSLFLCLSLSLIPSLSISLCICFSLPLLPFTRIHIDARSAFKFERRSGIGWTPSSTVQQFATTVTDHRIRLYIYTIQRQQYQVSFYLNVFKNGNHSEHD